MSTEEAPVVMLRDAEEARVGVTREPERSSVNFPDHFFSPPRV